MSDPKVPVVDSHEEGGGLPKPEAVDNDNDNDSEDDGDAKGAEDTTDNDGNNNSSSSNDSRQTSLKELKISRRSKREFSVPVYTAGAVVSWSFKLQDYDVGFGVEFQPQTVCDNDEADDAAAAAADSVEQQQHRVTVAQQVKIKGSKSKTFEGSHSATSVGQVVLVVDNSYSYMRSKYLTELEIRVTGDTETPYGTSNQAVDDDDGMHDVGRYELDMQNQVNGLSVNPDKWNAKLKGKISALRERLARKEPELYKQQVAKGFLSDRTIVRFLIARDYDVKVATKLLREVVVWRNKRSPEYIIPDANDERAKLLEAECPTGKITVPGRDKHGRAVLVFDNECNNTKDAEGQLNFLAWNMGLAERTMAPGVDKICLFIHLGRMSMSSTPSMEVIKETISVLGKYFPETLGTAILYKPPRYFMWLFQVVKPLLDPKTRSKIVFIMGDTSDGSKNDAKLRYLMGPNWKKLTGAQQPVPEEPFFSESLNKNITIRAGFNHEEYWRDVLAREAASLQSRVEQQEGTRDGAKKST